MIIEETKKYKAFYRQKKIVDYGTPGAFVQNKWSRQYYIVILLKQKNKQSSFLNSMTFIMSSN